MGATVQGIATFASALVLLAAGAGMAAYERTRIKAGRPILAGSLAVQLYWIGYLALFVLGFTLMLAAFLR